MKTISIRIVYISIIINLISALAYGQSSTQYKITGSLADDKGQAMDYATISLLKASDSTLVKGTLSSASGQYSFDKVNAGTYIIRVTAVGYIKGLSSSFVITAEKSFVTMPLITLHSASSSLATVTVTASRPMIERKTDRTVINVENSVLSAGNSALEILARAPGVTIDKDDNISLNGKAGVNVMINDKMTYLSAAQLGTLLRSTDGNTIKSIELMTNPSAKYDASGNAGIINIKLKKNMQTGTNGSVTLGAGYGDHARENGTFTLNHKQGNLNMSGTFSRSDVKNEFNLSQQRIVTDSTGNKTYFDQRSQSIRISHNNSYRVGADLSTGSTNTLGFLINGYFNTSGSVGNSHTNIGQQPDLVNFAQDQLSLKSFSYKNFSANLNDNLKLDTLGQSISFNLDYSRFNNRSDDQYDTHFSLPDGTIAAPAISLREQTPSVITIHTAKIDYTLPVTKTFKFETGAKYSDVKTDNDLNAQSLQGAAYINDSTLTNRFIYDEKVEAGYVNLSNSFGKTSVQVGLRAEHTSSDGNLINSGSDVKRSYTDLFPSIFVNQKLDDKNDLGVSYSKRIDRPDYSDLNPFLYYLDQYSYSKGNPFLNPQYTNKAEINYTYNHSLNIEIGYSHAYNYLTNVALTDPATKITDYTTLNLQHQNYYNISISSPYSITKWWAGNVNAVAYYSGFKTDSLLGGNYNRGQVSAHIQATQFFQIAKSYKAEILGNYDSPFIYGTYKFNHNIYSDWGLSHSFANKKASIKIAVSDIFNTNKTTMTSKYATNDITLHLKTESRITRLTFVYNFGNNSLKPPHHTTGADAEKSRVGN
jgi:iron complex outermembrane receptor protein